MTTITCDKCKNVLRSEDSRLRGKINWIHNEQEDKVIYLVHRELDFCSVACLSGFINTKLEEFAVGLKS